MRKWRWPILAALATCVLLFAAYFASASMVRSVATRRASEAGVNLSIESVRPSFTHVSLRNLTLTIPDVPAISLSLRELHVHFNGSLELIDATATIQGSHEAFREQLERWRKSREPQNETPANDKPRRIIRLRNASLRWVEPVAQSSLELQGVDVDDLLAFQGIRVGVLKAALPSASIEATDVVPVLSDSSPPLVQSIASKTVHLRARWDRSSPSALPPPESPSPASLRDRVQRGANAIWKPLTETATVQVDAFHALLEIDKDQVNFGPGRLAVTRSPSTLSVALQPGENQALGGVALRAVLPLAGGAVEVNVEGGPISLSSLGVRDGDFGLAHVTEAQLTANTHVRLHEDGRTATINGTLRATNLSVEHAKLAPIPVRSLNVAALLDTTFDLDGTRLELRSSSFELGRARLSMEGAVVRGPEPNVDLRFAVPMVECDSLLDAIPESLGPEIHGIQAAGTFALQGALKYSGKQARTFSFDFDLANNCRFTHVPDRVSASKFKVPFTRVVPSAKPGETMEVRTGPGSAEWTPFGSISRFMEAAVMTTEDGRFRTHRGYDNEAIRNSVRENIRAGKFVRGASTITMQLAKNLYLARDKTLSRKLQELILTSYLEQALTKEEILTLYLNAVEFAPGCYGIACAANHYFNTTPSELTLTQAFYIASVLPNPRIQHFASNGYVSDSWLAYLSKLMRIASKRGWITESELEEGLRELPARGVAQPERGEMHDDVSPNELEPEPGPSDPPP